MSPIVFEMNEDKIYKDNCCGESYAMFFLFMLKKKCRTSKHFAGPVGVTGPTGPVSFWVSVEAWQWSTYVDRKNEINETV